MLFHSRHLDLLLSCTHCVYSHWIPDFPAIKGYRGLRTRSRFKNRSGIGFLRGCCLLEWMERTLYSLELSTMAMLVTFWSRASPLPQHCL